MPFRIVSNFEPRGDQPEAIRRLVKNIKDGVREQVLLGVTGSGKTFTMANVIKEVARPALVIAPNKTLAAQLFGEFKALFPENAVEYFVSYYDYYQPEAYLPAEDLYIEKDAAINDAIDRMRLSATRSLLTRDDVIVVASVSCIYGLGSPEIYRKAMITIRKGEKLDRDWVLGKLVEMQYLRNDYDFSRGSFQVRGDILEIFPAYSDSTAIRVEWFGDSVERIIEIDPLTRKKVGECNNVGIFAASHYIAWESDIESIIKEIRRELSSRVCELEKEGKVLEAARLKQRTNFDLEMIRETGFCKGIENYSRYLTGRLPGEPPPTLLDYFPKDYLCFIDESHITIPQIDGMYNGDYSRKKTLVDYGFRLPSALDNRPLKFDEFNSRLNQVIYVSATPAEYELKRARGYVVEQLVRPTGLLDPSVEVRSARGAVEDLYKEIKERTEKNERVLVTTLTKRMAEDIAAYFAEMGIRARYMHSDIDTIERAALIRDLRRGEYDVLIGINLLREGLDIPEVSLVAILDADKEGFLRSERSLIQTFGRAARHINGKVILYADVVTRSMERAIKETNRRRKKQEAYNKKHGITPQGIKKEIRDAITSVCEGDYVTVPLEWEGMGRDELEDKIKVLREEMLKAASRLEFEKAAGLRDKIMDLERLITSL